MQRGIIVLAVKIFHPQKQLAKETRRACCGESFSGRLFYKSAVNQQADLSTDFCETPYLFAFARRRSVSQLCACAPLADAVSEAVVHQSRGRPAGLQDPAHAVG